MPATSAGIAPDRVHVAPLKGRGRAQEKIDDDYADRDPGPACAWLFDVVRAKVVCDTADEVRSRWFPDERRWYAG